MILTLADFKTYIEINDTNSDTRLTMLLENAYSEAENYTGRVFDNAPYTEYHKFSYTLDGFYVDNIPITAITSITIQETSLTENTDFYYDADTGLIKLVSTWTPDDWRDIKVVYTAGYTTDTFPNDLRSAIFQMAINNDRVAGNTTISIDSRLITYKSSNIFTILDRYKAYEI